MGKQDSGAHNEAGLKRVPREKAQQGKGYQEEFREKGQQGRRYQETGYRTKDQQEKGTTGKSKERYKKTAGDKSVADPGYKKIPLNKKNEAGRKKALEVTHGKASRFSDDFGGYEDFTPEQKKAIEQERGVKFGERGRPGAKLNKYDPGKRGKETTEEVGKRKTVCPYLRECGGCNILEQSYEAELKNKQKTVEDLLKDFCRVEPIIGMKNPMNYRNKVHVVFDHDRKGNPISGVYEEGTHRVIAIDKCMIHNQKADEIIASIRGMLKSFKIKTYDEDTGYGLLRHVMIRTGFTSGEIMVVLVLASPIMPSKNNFVKALRKLHPEITTVILNVNDKDTSMVLGEKEQVVYGKGYIEDSLCGKVFRISAKSFYQVNPVQTEVLYGKAIEFAGLTGTETVVDAYCGIGTIGIIASDKVKKVIGVELNKDAVKDAVINAKRNNAKNIEFYQNDASEFMVQMAQQGEKVDVVFMDPPRAGITEKFMDAVAVLRPGKVVYVSCNPVTLERDLGYFKKKGYQAQRAVPVDMFAWTSHVESIILMTNSGLKSK
ncbi:MAG TPA: 23S rRNA (uracil(1939)-C(5))-methyltransferase RlmD [Clostridiales bacterium]|nr:23S rRNA (uracil(1939)-C(5))-methyltransferase RlmD [Clostridiales bacterium]